MTTGSNSPESEALTFEDATIFENARNAIMALKKTFDSWITIGRALQRARRIADERGGRQTFQRLLEQQGLAKVVSQKATWTRLLQIMENLSEVTSWHETLTDKQKIEWAAPTTIFKHCPVFTRPKAADGKTAKPSPIAKMKEATVALQEENDRLKREVSRRQDGDSFKPTDKARDIAVVLVGMLTANKVEELIRELKKLLPTPTPSTPRKKAKRPETRNSPSP